MTNGPHPEELISASLTGELTDDERADLDRHLGGCARCRGTLAAFSADRQLVAGLRREAAPRDLGARVRTGLASGRATRPAWWRPSSIAAGAFGVVALGALVGIVVSGGMLNPPEVATSITPASTGLATVSAAPTSAPPTLTATPTSSVSAPPASPSVTPAPTQAPTTPEPRPLAGTVGEGYLNYLALTGTLGSLSTELGTYDVETDAADSVPTPLGDVSGPPVVIALSPDAEWIAYQTQVGQKGTNEAWAYHLEEGRSVPLGETEASAFGRRMSWSSDGRYVAFTLIDADAGDGPDAAVFDSDSGEVRPLTASDDVYAASFDGDLLWVSRAAETPASHLVALDADLSDLEAAALESVPGVFGPLVSPDGSRSIAWSGGMESADLGWRIASGGMLYLFPADGSLDPVGAAPLFADLPVEQDALVSANVAWSGNSDWFAVWGAEWAGMPLGTEESPYPASDRVYVGRTSATSLITADSAVGPTGAIVDVALLDIERSPFGDEAPTLAVTVAVAGGGEAEGAPGPRAVVVLAPAAASDASPLEIGDGTAWIGPVFYVPAGDE